MKLRLPTLAALSCALLAAASPASATLVQIDPNQNTVQDSQSATTNAVLGTATASPAANTIGDRLKTINTTLGAPAQAIDPANLVSGTTAAMTSTTSTSLLAAPGASLRNYVTQLTCVNSHAAVGTFVTVQDGSGGTALATVAAASLFGGTVVTFPSPLRQPTTNTGLYVADVTTGANVICSATGYKGA